MAAHLARMGFELVYQSRASRGAFDLLALRGAAQLGLQVKRTKLPVRFSAAAWARMEAESVRLGWSWAIAVVTPSGRVYLLDPSAARGRTLDAAAEIENLPRWVDEAAAQR